MSLTDDEVTAIRTTGLTDPEEWRAIPDFEGLYEVSNRGRVRSLSRQSGNHFYRGKIIYQFTKRRYACVRLSKPGKIKTFDVHRLVALAFVPGSGPLVRHLDGDSQHNVPSNLVWGTYLENSNDTLRHGTRNRGERNGHAVITADIVRQIRSLAAEGLRVRQIAERLKQSISRVKHVLNGEAWTHVI